MTVQELYNTIGGNYEEAKKRLMNDTLISKFVVRFLSDESYSKLLAAVESGDDNAIFEASHALKGVSANLALTSIAEIAGKLTEATRPGSGELRAALDLESEMTELTNRYTLAKTEIEKFKGA